MIRIAEGCTVDVAPMEAFLFAGRPENMPLWNTAVLSSRVNGELEQGATVVQLVRLPGHRFEIVYRVSRYEPHRRVTYTSIAGPVDVEGTMEFAPRKPGTSLQWIVSGDCRGLIRIAESVLVRMGRREMRACLRRLKELLESPIGVQPGTPVAP